MPSPQPSPLQPSQRAQRVGESVTLAISARAAEMRAQGIDIVSLSAGEPDFQTPGYIAAAGVAAIEAGDTRYTATSGLPEVRAAARRWFERTHGVVLQPDELIVTAGAKPALHMALLALVNEGDRVLIPAPYWVSYPDLVSVAGGQPAVIPPAPERGFILTPDALRAAAREHDARGVILNYPNNPSGAVPTAAQMEALVRATVDAGLWIVSDEIYASLVYDGEPYRSALTYGFARGRALVVGGGTKSHSLTGWRVGFLAGPAAILAAAGRIQSQVLGNPCTISQRAVAAMCDGDDRTEQADRLASFAARRRFVVEHIATLPGLSLQTPRGAFYALFDVRALCARLGTDDGALTARILEEAQVALVPGHAFGAPGFLRMSYAASMPDLEKGAARLRRFFEAL